MTPNNVEPRYANLIPSPTPRKFMKIPPKVGANTEGKVLIALNTEKPRTRSAGSIESIIIELKAGL